MPNENIKVLIVDDEKDVLRGLKDTLESHHFQTETALSGAEALLKAAAVKPDVVLLDLRLPDIDGIEVCRRMKQDLYMQHIPIIMLTTRSKDTEKAIGLELGADDYMGKPYSEVELLARVRAVLRRTRRGSGPALPTPSMNYVYRDVSVSVDSRTVMVGKLSIKLTKKEFELLTIFIASPGIVMRRTGLMEKVWGMQTDSLQNTVDTHIKTLRKKLGKAGAYIETVAGLGYRWTAFDGRVR